MRAGVGVGKFSPTPTPTPFPAKFCRLRPTPTPTPTPTPQPCKGVFLPYRCILVQIFCGTGAPWRNWRHTSVWHMTASETNFQEIFVGTIAKKQLCWMEETIIRMQHEWPVSLTNTQARYHTVLKILTYARAGPLVTCGEIKIGR